MPKTLKLYRNLTKAHKTRNRWREKNYDNGDFSNDSTRGSEWNFEDSLYVIEHKIPDRQLARRLHRSVRAIQARRFILNSL